MAVQNAAGDRPFASPNRRLQVGPGSTSSSGCGLEAMSVQLLIALQMPSSRPRTSRLRDVARRASTSSQQLGGNVLPRCYRVPVAGLELGGYTSSMIVRMFAISVVVISLAGVPPLCMAGIITHACECAAETACDCGDDCEHGSRCGHECGCRNDPCQIQVVRTDRQGDEVVTPPQLTASVVLRLIGERQHPFWTTRTTYDWSLRHGNRPYPPSDLPLLI
jgi:hypothetical protein